MNTDPSRAVYVGDHPVDAEAASRARVPFVGVLTGTSPAASFAAFAPVGIIETVAGLPAVLAKLP
jgi:phosphoglycolate phosphatase-like HAD superfamily hydrolase